MTDFYTHARMMDLDAQFDDEEDDDMEIIGYHCIGCGHVQDHKGWGGTCDQCSGMSLEEIWE